VNLASVCRALFCRAGASELEPRPDKKTIMMIINMRVQPHQGMLLKRGTGNGERGAGNKHGEQENEKWEQTLT